MIKPDNITTLKATDYIDKDCKKCYGRGFTSWNNTRRNACKCIKKNIIKAGYKPEAIKLV